MAEKFKTGLCVLALLLALLAAYMQERSFQQEASKGTAVQRSPFDTVVQIGPRR